jgi:hypothetical protein
MITQQPAASRLLWIGLAMLAAGAILRLVMGSRWFDFYGLATVTLGGALPLFAALVRGLEVRGYPRRLAAWVVVPLVLAALVQIGYWTAYFSSVSSGIQLGMGRLMLSLQVGHWILPAVLVCMIAAAVVVWLASVPHPRQ